MNKPTFRQRNKAGFRRRLQWLMARDGFNKPGGQSNLARRLQVKPVNVTRWLDGTQGVKFETADLIAREFRVDVDWVYWGTGEPPPGFVEVPTTQSMETTSTQNNTSEIHELQIAVAALFNSLSLERPGEGKRLAESIRAQQKKHPEYLEMEFLNKLAAALESKGDKSGAL